MADLKKVGVVLTAEGKGEFIRDLKDVNAELRENYSALKLQEEQFGKNISKQERMGKLAPIYAKDLQLQGDKVRTLKSELDELENAEVRNERAISNKRRELNYAEKDLSAYGKKVEEIERKLKDGTYAWENFADNLAKTGDKITGAGKKIAPISAVATGALVGMAKSTMDFDSAWVGVQKTMSDDITPKQLEDIKEGLKNLSKETGLTTTELGAVAEAAGQLGIKTENILSFTKTMTDMGVATNISSEEAASSLARFANVTQMSQGDFDKLGSVIVELGNNFATTEKDIVAMSMNLGAAGTQIGMSESDIVALATSLSSVGLEAAAGGTSFSKLMVNMQLAVETGSDDLEDFANVAGMTGAEFQKAFQEDATGALQAFIGGLDGANESGDSAIKILDDMGIKETRLRDSILRSAGASDLLTEATKMGNEAWEENSALTTEADLRYESVQGQMDKMKASISVMATNLGEHLIPIMTAVFEKIGGLADKFGNLSEGTQTTILVILGLVAALAPVLIIIGKTMTGVAALMKILVPIKAAIVALSVALNLPVIAIVAIGAAVAAFVFLVVKYWDEIKAVSKALFDWIGTAISTLWTNVTTAISGFVTGAMELLAKPFDFLKNVFLVIVALVAVMLEGIWNFIKPGVDKVVALFNTFKTTITNIFTAIKTAVGNVFSSLVGLATGPIGRIKSAFTTVGEAIKTVFRGVKSFVGNIFSTIGGLIKSPINGIISGINAVLRTMNRIKIPKWVPGLGGKGINFGMISYLAKGGNLMDGQAMIAESGPELLQMQGGKATVTPLSDGGGARKREIMDYDEMGRQFRMALSGARFALDDDGFVRLIDDRLYEVM